MTRVIKSNDSSVHYREVRLVSTLTGESTTMKVSFVVILIGSSPNMSFLEEKLTRDLGVVPDAPIDRGNPVNFDLYTNQAGILFLKHVCSILRQSSYSVCGSWQCAIVLVVSCCAGGGSCTVSQKVCFSYFRASHYH